MTDIDTQTREYYENLKKARRRKKLQTDTDKFERGAAKALFEFGLHTLTDTVNKVVKIAEGIDKRMEEQMDADIQSLSALLNTKKAKLKGK